MPIYWKNWISLVQSQLAFALLSFRYEFFAASFFHFWEFFECLWISKYLFKIFEFQSINISLEVFFPSSHPISNINLYQIFQKSFEKIFVFHKYLYLLWYEINAYFTVFYPCACVCGCVLSIVYFLIFTPFIHLLIVIVNECLFIKSFIWLWAFYGETGTQLKVRIQTFGIYVF